MPPSRRSRSRSRSRSTTTARQLPIRYGDPRGGRRKGAGRPPKTLRSAERHKTRERFHRTTPLHITIRTVPAVRNLRQRDAYHAFRRALATTFKRADFRVCHLSIQSNHVHLAVEADDHESLARGMQGFQISAARQLNRAMARRGAGAPRRGQVFADRYHASRLTSPTRVRNALLYIFCNWRRHGVDQRPDAPRRLDPYSSAIFFDGWADQPRPLLLPAHLRPLLVALPHSWLLSTGWRRVGLLSPDARPGGLRA